jgi:NADH:ubiquinone oxidoreductase subunit 6 (subunit J)
MTLELAIVSMLAGIALGLRYKVFVLVPAVGLTIVFAAMGGIAHGDRLWSIVLATAILGTAVQFGYLAGIVIRATAGSICASILGSRNPGFNAQTGRT